jgi:hypothetical protein
MPTSSSIACSRAKELIERDGRLRHSFKTAREFPRDVEARGCQHFRYWTVVAEDVDDESFPQVFADALVREKVADIEQVARMLAVQRRDELASIKVGEADDLDFSETELRFDDRDTERVFGSSAASQRRCWRARSPCPPPANR